jgi:hypothetical protein
MPDHNEEQPEPPRRPNWQSMLTWLFPRGRKRRRKSGDLDEEFAEKYFTLLVGQYKTMSKTVEDAAARAEAERIVKIPTEEITWEEIYRFELAILKLEPLESLCRKAWILREEYQEIASEAEREHYRASSPPEPDPTKVKESELRADLVKIQEELNWAYTVLWVQEEFRGKLTHRIVWMTFLVGAVFVALMEVGIAGGFASRLPLAAVAFTGMVGGFISTLRRIQTSKLDGNSDLNLIELERGQGSIYISPFLGAIFAMVLYVLFASGLIKGALFPDFPKTGGLYGFASPLEGVEQAKLLVWSFVAGFAEKFVPDRLDQLSQRAKENEPGAAAGK